MVSGTDLPTVLVAGGVGLAVTALFVALMVWDARRRKSPSVLLDVISTIAGMWVAFVLLSVVFTVIRWGWADATDLTSLPLSIRWPEALPCQSGETAPSGEGAILSCAAIDSARATVTGLDAGLRALLGAGNALTLIVAAIPGVVIFVLSAQAMHGTPFAGRTSRWLLISAIVVLVAGTLGSLLSDVGSFLVAQSVLAEPIADAPLTAPTTLSLNPPVWPLGVALGLGALSVIFRQGARLQRETEGLV